MWPPFEVGHEGFVRALMPIVAGTRASIKAIRAAQPHAEIWLNDGADRYRASTPDLEPLAARLTLEHYAGLDLIEGRATTDSEMYDHLKHSGFDPLTLERYVAEPTPVDVIGLDYYPGTEHLISPRTSLERAPGDWGKRQDYALSADPQAIGIAASFVDYYRRYEKPLYLSETSSDSRRSEWLEYSTHECAGARAKGIPVIGYTWWPLFDHIDWNSGLTTLEGFVCPSGLYHLQPSLDHRSPSPLVPEFKQKIQQGLPTNLKQLQIPLPH